MDNIGGIIIISLVVVFCDIVFIAIGMNYLKSKAPLGFFTGEKPPKPEEISDIKAWNKKHGIAMFICAGLITIGCFAPVSIPDETVAMFVFIGAFAVALAGIVIYHNYLTKKYKIKSVR